MLMGQAVHYRATSSPSSSSCLYPVHRLAHVAPTSSRPSRQVMSRKPLGILLTLLESTLAGVLVSVDSKGLTDMLTPLDATLTKNRGRGRPRGRPQGRPLASSIFIPAICVAILISPSAKAQEKSSPAPVFRE